MQYQDACTGGKGLVYCAAVRVTPAAVICCLALLCDTAAGAGISGAQGTALKTRRTSARVPARQQAVSFSTFVLKACKEMPVGGGYKANSDTIRTLSSKAVYWDEQAQRLHVELPAAQPSFCSAACYVALLRAFELWQQHIRRHLPPQAWQALDIAEQKDGIGIWGRANANGPGFAKLVHDLGAGVNFTELQQARAGDFLKFFWNGEIGARERGHIVVFLGTAEVDGQPAVRYWSANKPDGFSERTVPLAKMHHLIFTRITKPENFANASKLPATDAWLRDMQKNSVPFDEVCKRCGIATASKPQSPQNPSSHNNQ